MPKYRYVCPKCGAEKVLIHGINEQLEIKCDECGEDMQKAIPRVGVIFKSGGFYSTENKKS